MKRRDFLLASAAAAGAMVTSDSNASLKPSKSSKPAKRTLRFAHFTDLHLEPKRSAPQGFAQALNHMQALPDKPELLITGGDHVMDSFAADDNWTSIQFNLVKETIAQNCKIPVKYCIGNHDAWGWNKEHSKTTGSEPNWGKNRPVTEFKMPGRYYAFDVKPWRIIILDSTHEASSNYQAKLDDEQMAWLENELNTNKDKFIAIVSHIPILSVAAYLDGENEKKGNWSLPKEWMHLDARKLKDMFLAHGKVKLCVSGHLHLVDRNEYCGTTYICDGAVCGAWWKGNHMECDEGYGVFDLYTDGTFDHQYIAYDWVAQPDTTNA